MTANRIIAHVFLQPSLHLVNEAAMEQLVADHPYFSAARLLLARKVFQKTGDLQSPAVKKALLYTNQHHYAYQVISEEQVLQEVENRIAPAIQEDTLPVETIIAPVAVADTPSLVEEIAATTALPVVEDRIPAVIPEDALPVETAPLPEASTAVTIETALPIEENHVPVTIHDEVVPVDMSTSVAAEIAATIALPVVEDRIPVAIPEDALPVGATPEFTTTIADEEVHHFSAVTEDVVDNATTAAATVITELPETPAPVAAQAPVEAEAEVDAEAALPIKIFPLTTATEETELIFQPLYTDDYFAYKRLKNPEEADELNAQGAAEMKSFTSWLRQMKDNFVGKTSKDWYHQQLHRIYEEEDEPEVSETVEKMAMDSIVFNNDIVSETLAEIWVRQQQYSNAIKIYQKLSLLNPDKNAYFAQKILELKSQTDKKNKQ